MRTMRLLSLCLGLVLFAQASAIAQTPAVTSVTLVEKAGVTTANYPVTLSLVFKKGDVTGDTVTARVAGQTLPTQTDVKARYDDQSIKHAMASFLVPSLPAGGQVIVEILAGGTNANTNPVSLAELLATDFEAALTVSVAGTPTPVTARQLMQTPANIQMWLQGDICSEFLVRDLASSINNQLNVQYRVRLYRGYSGIRIDTVVENTWCNYRGNLTYDFALSFGQASPATVFAKTGFTQYYCTRWRKVLWQGSEPAAVQVKYNLPYLIATGMVPRYDTRLVVPESTISTEYTKWLATNHDIMGNGIIYKNMSDVAGRQDIGLLPTWTARYLLTMDNRMREIMINAGEMSGSVPVHFRESDPTRSFYGRILSIDDRPTVWINWWDYPYTASKDRMPAPVGSASNNGWGHDTAHQPSLAYIPYLITGDYYFLEEMWFWSSWNLACDNWEYRQGTKGLFTGQTRGIAWALRNCADAANMSPDGAPEKAYITQKINNNFAYWQTTYVNGYYPTVRYLKTQYNGPGDAPDGSLDATCVHYTSPWMDDFVLLAIGHAKDIGFAGGPMIDWLGKSIINRFSHPGFNHYRGAAYHIPVDGKDEFGQTVKYPTWQDVNDAFANNVGPSDFVNPDYPYDYTYIARAALTRAVHMPNGRTTWNWLDGALYSKAELNKDPTWAFVPAPLVGDVNNDAYVNVGDLQLLVAAWGSGPSYSGSEDINSDGYVNVGDLQLLVANWGNQ